MSQAEIKASLPIRKALADYSLVAEHPIDTLDRCERVIRFIGTSVSFLSIKEMMAQEDGLSVETILHLVANALRYEVQARDAAMQVVDREGQA